MLGRFLEIGIQTADIRASVEFYERLGFTQAQTGDTWSHPYGVLTDGRLYIGLHQSRLDSPALTFVHPGVSGHAAALQHLGVELTTVNVDSEVFNELAFRDPAGHPVRLLEARTYSPADRSPDDVSLCGRFRGISLPAADLARVSAFWQTLGLVASDEQAEPYPHLPLGGDGRGLALHASRFCAEPLLVFCDAQMSARIAHLRALGAAAFEPPPRGLGTHAAALLRAPEGTALMLLQHTGDLP